MADVVGVDAAGALGWAVVVLRDGRLLELAAHATLRAVVDAYPHAEAFGVDIPLGHEDPTGIRGKGRRLCDEAAREFLPPGRRSTIFWVPPLRVLAQDDHAAAIRTCRERGWHAPSIQVWNLRRRILEAHELSRAEGRLFEVHPEVSFNLLAQIGEPMRRIVTRKATHEGRLERIGLLHAANLRPTRSLGGIGRASPEDVLDATISAWTAARIATNTSRTFPSQPPTDPVTRRPVAVHA
jgi:predicted RNase H-like nuclease